MYSRDKKIYEFRGKHLSFAISNFFEIHIIIILEQHKIEIISQAWFFIRPHLPSIFPNFAPEFDDSNLFLLPSPQEMSVVQNTKSENHIKTR